MAESALERAWYRPKSWAQLLLPLSWLFCRLANFRRRRLLSQPRTPIAAPVIVVGNISVGGTGKTPLLLTMIDYFLEQGYRPGVISRGYGGKSDIYPCRVTALSSSSEVGDEPLLYVDKCPVVVDPDRDRAARYLLENSDCNVIFSDDGLQHYSLRRDIEIAVVDGQRGFGNGYCLPAGPLRELPERLQSVDFVVVNGKKNPALQIDNSHIYEMQIEPQQFRSLTFGGRVPANKWANETRVHAVAGIGNPQRFVVTLQQLGFEPELHAYSDHHQFTGDEFNFADNRPVIITAKDAVKCKGLVNDKVWALDVKATLPAEFLDQLRQKIDAVQSSLIVAE